MPLKLKRRAPPEEDSVLDPRVEFGHYRSQLQIDKHSLDDECIRQPVLYQEISEAHTMACSERDAAKEALAVADALLSERIRNNWNEEGEKVNEKKVADAVLVHPEHSKAFQHYTAMARRASYLQSLVISADARGKMLRELGQLFVTGYFDRVHAGKGKKDTDSALAAAGREGMRRARARNED